MVQLTFYGGVGEIGGNKVLLEDGGTRLFLDMGEAFQLKEKYFTEYLMPRARFGLRDYFALDLVPKIPGLYAAEALAATDFPYRSPEFHGILISHPHWDHVYHLGFVDKAIPVHLGHAAKEILDSAQATSKQFDLGDHDYRTFRTGSRLKVDDVEVEPFHVDHSVPGAYGFLVHTSEGTVAYTGDLRRHGTRAEMTDDFVEAARAAKPRALVCEGTRVGREDRANYTEAEVRAKSVEAVKTAGDRLVVATFYPRDVDRIRTFHEVAKATDRTFVVSAKTAHLLRSMEGDPRIRVPNPLKDPNVLVYFRSLSRTDRWEDELQEAAGKRGIGAAEVRKHQKDYLLQLDFTHLTELVDIQPKPGSVFIHSKSEPFEEDDIEDQVKNNWLSHFGMVQHQYHASGHLSPQEIGELLETVNPKAVVPVHTERPDLFTQFGKKVVPPEPRKPMQF